MANSMLVCVEHAARLVEYVSAALESSPPLSAGGGSSGGERSDAVLRALSATFHDGYMVALLWIRDCVLGDVAPLLREVGAVGSWQSQPQRAPGQGGVGAPMSSALATVADYFTDTEQELLPRQAAAGVVRSPIDVRKN